VTSIVRELPLVALVCRVPLLAEAVAGALAGIAEIRTFPVHPGETASLLSSLEPNAIVVDDEAEADEAAPFARGSHTPLVHISVKPPQVRVLREVGWETVGTGAAAASPESLRNLVVASIYGREGVL
jgi:hypothetical protein